MSKFGPIEELLSCDICDENAKWKCSICDELFCNQCRLVHIKSKATRDHHVISITDTPVVRIPKGKSIKQEVLQCEIHPDEEYKRYCTDCKCLVCFDCCVSKHSGHNFLKIAEAIKNEAEIISSNLEKLKEVQLPALRDVLQQIKQMRLKYDEDVGKSVQELGTKAEQLKKEVDKIKDELLRILQMRSTEDQAFFKDIENNLSQRISDMDKLIHSTEENLQQPSDHAILKLSNEIKQSMESYRTPELPKAPWPPTFKSSKIDANCLKSMCGYVDIEQDDHKASDIDESPPVIDVEAVSSFNNTFAIGYMSAAGDNAWVANYSGDIALLSREGKTLFTSSLTNISDIAANKDGELFMAKKMSIQKLTQNGTVSQFANTSPYEPQGITISDNGRLLVLMINYNNTNTKLCKLQRFSFARQVLNEIDISYPLQNPRYVSENVNLDVWIQDNTLGKVVVLDKTGKHRFDYSGTKNEKLESPRSLVHNKFGQVLIVDHAKNAVHLVDKNGIFLQYILYQEGLNNPNGITIDTYNNIWVGCNEGSVVVAKYLK